MSQIGKTKKDILKILSKKQHTITDISNMLNLSPSTVKQHFDELQEMGAIQLVQNEFIKRWKYYKTTPNFSLDSNTQDQAKINYKGAVPYAIGALAVLAILSAIFVFGLFNNNSNTLATAGTSSHSSNTLTTSLISASAASTEYALSVQLTDPPHVPENTQALILNYSSFSVNVLKGNTYEWINVSGSGSVNLMSLVNISQIMGNTFLNSSYKVVGVALNVNSAYIKINNITYSIIVPEKQIYANLSNQTTINSNSSVLVDFSPTVSSIYSSNSTLFVMTPSVKAMFYGNYSFKNKSDYEVGRKFDLNNSEFLAVRSNGNITITSANIIQYGNLSNILNSSTKISVTIRNNGNKTIVIKQILLSGKLTSHILLKNDSMLVIRNNGFQGLSVNISKINISRISRNPFHIIITGNDNISNKMNITDAKADNLSKHYIAYPKLAFDSFINNVNIHDYGLGNGNLMIVSRSNTTSNILVSTNSNFTGNVSVGNIQGHYILRTNTSTSSSLTNNSFDYGTDNGFSNRYGFDNNRTSLLMFNLTGEDVSEEHVGFNMVLINQLMFLISKNGTMTLPGNGPISVPFNNSGYSIAPGASVTFTFNGSILCGNGRIIGSFSNDSSYNLIVIGTKGSFAYANVISS